MTKRKKPEDKLKNGRPTKMTPEVQEKFIQGFKLGFNDSECAAYAEICRDTYMKFRDENPDFLRRVNAAKEHPFLMAKHTIAKSMGKPEVAKWYLEKRRKDEFGDVKKIEFENLDQKFANMSVEEKAQKLIEDGN